jgi:hypothetical protein
MHHIDQLYDHANAVIEARMSEAAHQRLVDQLTRGSNSTLRHRVASLLVDLADRLDGGVGITRMPSCTNRLAVRG